MALFKSDGAVGLELDTGVIRAVYLKGSPQTPSLVAAGQVEIPERAVIEGVVNDSQAVSSALTELCKNLGIGNQDVVLGICNQGVIMRRATFPKITDKQLAQALKFQAGEYFPIPMNQLVFDYSVMGESERENGTVLDILMVGARRDLLDKCLGSLTAANLEPKVIDAAPLALMRTLSAKQQQGTYILVDISNGLSTLMLVSEGIPQLTRVIPHSFQNFAREYNLPLTGQTVANELVAAASEGNGALDSGTPQLQWSLVLANEIRSSINYYLAQNPQGTLDRVILSGRGSLIVGLVEFLENELELTTEKVNPIKNIKTSVPEKFANIMRVEPEYAVCTGLALRGLED